MARYTSIQPGPGTGEKSIASLELDGYVQEEDWKGDETTGHLWPVATVNALVHLFTGVSPDNDRESAGVEIPDRLGWHIATLIELWADPYHPIDEMARWPHPPAELRDWNENPHGQADKEKRARHRQRTVQQWYSDGIRIFQATGKDGGVSA